MMMIFMIWLIICVCHAIYRRYVQIHAKHSFIFIIIVSVRPSFRIVSVFVYVSFIVSVRFGSPFVSVRFGSPFVSVRFGYRLSFRLARPDRYEPAQSS